MNADLNEISERIIGCAYPVSHSVRGDGHGIGFLVTNFNAEYREVRELKAVSGILSERQAQLLSYGPCGSFQSGLLVNLGRSKVQIMRTVHQL